MNSLSNALLGLLDFLKRNENLPPTQDVRIIEINAVHALDDRGRFRVRREDFFEPADYEARFEALMSLGLSWINVSCYGVHDGKLIVAIELPQTLENTSIQTSVNYSGPTTLVLKHGWNVDRVLAIE